MNTFKVDYFLRYIPRILSAMPVTLLLTVFSLLLALALGVLFCALRLGKYTVLNRIAGGYITFIRGVPQLVLIFLLYLGGPQLLKQFGINVSGVNNKVYLVVIFAIALSAPISEMMRSAYLAVDKTQREAALSVGMTSFAAFYCIVFPQAFGMALPVLGNTVIGAFKLTALAFSIGVADLMGKARLISAQGLGTRKLEAYLAVALIYWGSCVVLEQANRLFVRWYSRGRKQQQEL
jgi:L-cystine transport system permease protein